MAQQNLVAPPFNAPFNTSDSAEKGDTPTQHVAKQQANNVELYGKLNVAAKYSTNAASGATTAAAGDLTGATDTICNYSAVGAANLTTRTAAQMIADAGLVVGQTYVVEIMNSSGTGPMAVIGGTGVTISGSTTTIAAGIARWFMVTVNSLTTMTFQNLGSGTI